MDNDATRKNGLNVPIWERSTLTVEEAAAYSGIGRNKLRSITDKEDCDSLRNTMRAIGAIPGVLSSQTKLILGTIKSELSPQIKQEKTNEK